MRNIHGRVFEQDQFDIGEKTDLDAGTEAPPGFRLGFMIDHGPAGHTVPVIEPVAWMNILSREEGFHGAMSRARRVKQECRSNQSESWLNI
jgi:hypothetical protein